ncbi:glycosyltransferase [Nitrospirillum sp. BR 11828]|uniref:glycosyltransferase n=1 Tax=Nitrospirillum sp. BR 11828 TaxID=3104325 RepID=UPI002ACAE5F4|nr:glycosyltransferase [Nitrospirillum sp. BR 11828]MDZ5645628.1 glycosyltransferase [Nitrospirillum sp. BR 11828]
MTAIAWTDIFVSLYRSDQFDPDFYVRRYPDVALSGVPPLEHYCKYGVHFGRETRAARLVSHEEAAPQLRTATSITESADCCETARATGSRSEIAALVDVPVLTVICTTYNHANFIRQTLEGFVAQRTNFPFVVLVSDDCSPDGTGEIVEEYVRKYPFIKSVRREKNVGSIPNLMDLARRVHTKYVALCEGDDYWTDPEKLQLQVDFLDSNPEYALCFHPVSILNEDDPSLVEVFPPKDHQDFTLATLARSNFIQTNSVMYRWRYENGLPAEFAEIHPGDWFIHLVHAEMGRIGYINRNMGVYRKHGGGMWSDATKNPLLLHLKYGAGEIRMFEAMKSHFGGQYDHLMSAMQRHVVGEVFRHFVLSGDILGLAAFIRAAQPCERLFLEICGIPIGEDGAVGSVEALERLLRNHLRISVVVTAYKHRDYLRLCLDSILAQVGGFEMELIIGDDCSRDGSQEIIDEYLQRHPGIVKQIRSSSNVGMLQNMKRCFAAASAPFIAICEGDDHWISSQKLAKQLVFLCLNRDCSMVFNWILLYEEWSTRLIPHTLQGLIMGDRLSFSALAAESLTANFSACVYRASTIRAIPKSYYTYKGAADWLFNLHAATIGDIGFIPDLMSVYRVHRNGQWSGLSTQQQQKRIKDIRREFYEIFGTGLGFDDLSVTYSIQEEADITGQVLAWLETPVAGQTEKINEGSITLRGWAITAIGAPVEIMVKHGEVLEEHATTVLRDDVVDTLNSSQAISIVSPRCGFSISVPYERSMSVNLGFRIHGRPLWWRTITLQECQSAPN